ncbi:MAG: hypothetical protein N2255_09690, partial [Kiritimatiellae bacterium]|nr:hypothetical protein [Kiritimatiellia bacterium]
GFGPGLQEAAEKCAKVVVERIRAGIFWPPARKVEYDQFDKIFCSDVVGAVDGSRLERLARMAKDE